MKKIHQLFLAVCLSLGIIAGTMNIAVANQNCYVVAGHWEHGIWYPKHKVCYHGNYRGMHCKWVKGYYHHGKYFPSHKVCWRR